MQNKISRIKDSKNNFRNLSSDEINQLKNQQNISEDWGKLFVSDVFDPSLIRNCHFIGINYLGDLHPHTISAGSLELPAGLYNSMIKNCRINKNIAIHNVAHLSNYLISEGSVLFCINEISCSDNPAFGNGFNENDRNWIEAANENGGRKLLPFEGMLTADAFLWYRFREDIQLIENLQLLTDKIKENNVLPHGFIGEKCVIKNVKAVIDCKTGSNCVIDGASHLQNITIQSSKDEPSFIGDEVELMDSIIGFNNKIVTAAKVFSCLTGRNVKIEMGARIKHSIIGSNSTIACCEVLNNLIYPFHEQHHNNSFLIASIVMGQSNIAAGATIGSNHNSRAADGEIIANRGFWPGLETDFKHNSLFASFTLIAKGSYENELNIKLPFCLLSKDSSGNLQIFPAFWFRYNMYALARNSWKFAARDKRKIKEQNIEMDYLAPDTLFEIMSGIAILEEAIFKTTGTEAQVDAFSFKKIDELDNVYLDEADVKHKTHVLKPLQSLWIYKNLIGYMAAKEIVHFYKNEKADIQKLFEDLPPITHWNNFGGQLISDNESQKLIADIKARKLDSWSNIHQRYNSLWKSYPLDKLKFSLACWLKMENIIPDPLPVSQVKKLIEHSIQFNNALLEWTIEARRKDYDNPFRKATYRNMDEMEAVLGSFEDNSFIAEMKKEHETYLQQAHIVNSYL
jgi:Domain of unknown function (DUF4954)/Domain of unknown function (DUF6819)